MLESFWGTAVVCLGCLSLRLSKEETLTVNIVDGIDGSMSRLS